MTHFPRMNGMYLRHDGAKNRGTYRLDGMTLELKADDGTVTRVISMPMDAALKSIYLFGKSYTRKERAQ